MVASMQGNRPRNDAGLKGRVLELDGVRGLAILIVLFFHYVVGKIALRPGTWQAYVFLPLGLGWSGVDLFFVLSGFLIGGILYDARNSDNYFKVFYLRRIHRIFPIYYVVLALFVTGLFAVGAHPSAPLRIIFNRDIPIWSYPFLFQNFLMHSHRGWGTVWLGVTWSLSIEEQFYIVLPFALRRLGVRGITVLVSAAILFAPVLRTLLIQSGDTIYGPYTMLPCRADALGLGVLVAIACRQQVLRAWLASHRVLLYSLFLMLGCGVLGLSFWQRYLFGIGLTWIAAFYAVLLVLVAVEPGRVERAVFRNRLLTGLGTIAYAVYLLHQGINALVHFVFFHARPAINGFATFSATLLSLFIVLSVSAISWKVLERPLILRAHSRYRYSVPIADQRVSANSN